jgi:hypothetical protein
MNALEARLVGSGAGTDAGTAAGFVTALGAIDASIIAIAGHAAQIPTTHTPIKRLTLSAVESMKNR